jgi:serine O-acetyltransferase
MTFWTTIRSDFRFARERDPAAVSRLEILLAYPGFHALVLHRLAHTLFRAGLPILPRVLSHFNRWITGIEIHPGADIAVPCFIDHGMGVVIGETAILGPRCHLHQGVTLGGTSTRRERRHPNLGSDVTIGAGAQIIGAVTIGDGARIGAGSVVISNVPAHATVVGVPGHVVAYYDPGDDTILRLPDPEHDRIEQIEQRLRAIETRLEQQPQPDPVPGDPASPTHR